MDLTTRRQELVAIERLLEYVRANAADLRPVPGGLLSALSVALEEVHLEAASDPANALRQAAAAQLHPKSSTRDGGSHR